LITYVSENQGLTGIAAVFDFSLGKGLPVNAGYKPI
jgi:phosphohistidine swiveling domain-containing protein